MSSLYIPPPIYSNEVSNMYKNPNGIVVQLLQPVPYAIPYLQQSYVNEVIKVKVRIFSHQQSICSARLHYKNTKNNSWLYTTLHLSNKQNSTFTGCFMPTTPGLYIVKIETWINQALQWQQQIIDNYHANISAKRFPQKKNCISFLKKLQLQVQGIDQLWITRLIKKIKETTNETINQQQIIDYLTSHQLSHLLKKYDNQRQKFTPNITLKFRVKALFKHSSSCYHFVPQPTSTQVKPLKAIQQLIPYLTKLKFSTLLLPPIYQVASESSCYSLNVSSHFFIDKRLGDFAEFKALQQLAASNNIQLALPLSFVFTQQHEITRQQPRWFTRINSPYQPNTLKIYQPDFKGVKILHIAKYLLSIVLFWVRLGVGTFWVSINNHIPFSIWHWLIDKTHAINKQIVFIAEHKHTANSVIVNKQLKLVGFDHVQGQFQYYNEPQALKNLVHEIAQNDNDISNSPSLWPNTPSSINWSLQSGHESTFMLRYFLAATLGEHCGIFGPAFENKFIRTNMGTEQYHPSVAELNIPNITDFDEQNKLHYLIHRLNTHRQRLMALKTNGHLIQCEVKNDNLIAYYKQYRQEKLLMVANLNVYHKQEGLLRLPSDLLQLINNNKGLVMHDILSEQTYIWHQEWNYIALHPSWPFHLFQVKTN